MSTPTDGQAVLPPPAAVTVIGNVAEAQPTLPDWAPALPDLPPVNPYDQPDPRSMTEAQRIAAMDAPAVRPSEYVIDVHPENAGTPETMAEVRGIQSLLYAAGMPANEGNGLMQAIAVEVRATPSMPSSLEFEQLVRSTEATLTARLGAEELGRRQASLGRLLTDLDSKSGGKLGDYIEEHAHVLMKPLVYSRLLAHAARLDERKRK